MRVVTCGKARIKYTDWEAKPLIGMLVEIESAQPGPELEASAVTVKLRDGTALRPAAIFLAKDTDEVLDWGVSGPVTLLGLEIGLGSEVFSAEEQRIALGLESETRLTYKVMRAGKAMVGFLFPERAAAAVGIDLKTREVIPLPPCR